MKKTLQYTLFFLLVFTLVPTISAFTTNVTHEAGTNVNLSGAVWTDPNGIYTSTNINPINGSFSGNYSTSGLSQFANFSTGAIDDNRTNVSFNVRLPSVFTFTGGRAYQIILGQDGQATTNMIGQILLIRGDAAGCGGTTDIWAYFQGTPTVCLKVMNDSLVHRFDLIVNTSGTQSNIETLCIDSQCNWTNLFTTANVDAFSTFQLTSSAGDSGTGVVQIDNICVRNVNDTAECNAVASAPNFTINSPVDGYHNTTRLVVNVTINDADGDNSNVSLYINGTRNTTAYSVANATTLLINVTTATMSEGNYSWYIYACDNTTGGGCTNMTARSYVVDSSNPVIIWNTFFTASNQSIVRRTNLTLNVTCNDTYLYRLNSTVWNSSGGVVYNRYFSNLSGNITVNFQDLVNFTREANYTASVACTDSHTFGGLNGLSYDISPDLKYFNLTVAGLGSRKIFLGYRKVNGDFSFLTSAEVTTFNISFDIQNVSSEYKFALRFLKPTQNVSFGFAIQENPNLELINPSIGHFVWNNGMRGWYMDFSDLPSSGYPLSYANVAGYHLVYSNTSYCAGAPGSQCVIGG